MVQCLHLERFFSMHIKMFHLRCLTLKIMCVCVGCAVDWSKIWIASSKVERVNTLYSISGFVLLKGAGKLTVAAVATNRFRMRERLWEQRSCSLQQLTDGTLSRYKPHLNPLTGAFSLGLTRLRPTIIAVIVSGLS